MSTSMKLIFTALCALVQGVVCWAGWPIFAAANQQWMWIGLAVALFATEAGLIWKLLTKV